MYGNNYYGLYDGPYGSYNLARSPAGAKKKKAVKSTPKRSAGKKKGKRTPKRSASKKKGKRTPKRSTSGTSRTTSSRTSSGRSASRSRSRSASRSPSRIRSPKRSWKGSREGKKFNTYIVVNRNGDPKVFYHPNGKPYYHQFDNAKSNEAAKKAAQRGLTHFYLQNVKSEVIREYNGGVDDIDPRDVTSRTLEYLEKTGRMRRAWIEPLGPLNKAPRKPRKKSK